MKKDRVSVDHCQGEGCICSEIKKKRTSTILAERFGVGEMKSIQFFGGPPPTTPPMVMMALAQQEVEMAKRGRVSGAYPWGRS